MVLADYEADKERKWPLGQDIIDECQAVEQLPASEEDQWKPLFEPTDFNEEHRPLELDKFRLTPAQLENWALRAVKIRASIIERVSLPEAERQPSSRENEQSQTVVDRGRGCKGHKRSTPAKNVEGRSEQDLRQ